MFTIPILIKLVIKLLCWCQFQPKVETSWRAIPGVYMKVHLRGDLFPGWRMLIAVEDTNNEWLSDKYYTSHL